MNFGLSNVSEDLIRQQRDAQYSNKGDLTEDTSNNAGLVLVQSPNQAELCSAEMFQYGVMTWLYVGNFSSRSWLGIDMFFDIDLISKALSLQILDPPNQPLEQAQTDHLWLLSPLLNVLRLSICGKTCLLTFQWRIHSTMYTWYSCWGWFEMWEHAANATRVLRVVYLMQTTMLKDIPGCHIPVITQ